VNISIRCDAGPEIGAGHVMRCLALSQEAVDRNHDITFYMESGRSLLVDNVESEKFEIKSVLPMKNLYEE